LKVKTLKSIKAGAKLSFVGEKAKEKLPIQTIKGFSIYNIVCLKYAIY
jgi:hypothetical protein